MFTRKGVFVCRQAFVVALTIALVSTSATADAETVVAVGTITAVDTNKWTISVSRQTATGEKTGSFTVARNARISCHGKATGLEALKPQQSVRLSYDTIRGVVVNIIVPKTIRLFDGRTLQGWEVRGIPKSKGKHNTPWSVDPERQVLRCSAVGHSYLESQKTFSSFLLALEYRFRPGGSFSPNGSGVVVRSGGLVASDFGDPSGIEIDIRPEFYKPKMVGTGSFICYGTRLHNDAGSTDGKAGRHLGVRREPPTTPIGQWNTLEITCVDDEITVTLNGQLVNKGWGAEIQSGTLCLRNANSDVEFRNIVLTPLDDAGGQ